MPERKPSRQYPNDLPAWQALKRHRSAFDGVSLTQLFADDPDRFENFSLAGGDLFLDYSKNLLTSETRQLLEDLADQAGVKESIAEMFAGVHINATEDRAVLHTALRAENTDDVGGDEPGVAEVGSVLAAMADFVDAVHAGELCGAGGAPIREIVNIGIGGSDLGPVMASRALRRYWRPPLRFHSASNVDGTQLADIKEELDPSETLFVICSKTFTTQETMSNARAARQWIAASLGEPAVAQHFAAASTNHAAMDAFGIRPDYRFGFWDWVGGRYSLWSAVGLSLALVIGTDNFRQLLAGGRAMDRHFLEARTTENLPMLLALIAIWYNNFWGADSQAILPYDNRLDRFPAYLQQLQMESNGKSVRTDGAPVQIDTGMVIWGEAGSNAQHSFYQLLHQGTRFVPADFLLPVRSSGAGQEQQDLAIANCLAQSEALMAGFESEDPHRRHPGNRPSNTILFDELTPHALGQLIAAYEHKVFVEGLIWGINSFDQFGVELGKRLASSLEAPARGAPYEGDNASTRGLLDRVRSARDPV